MYDARLSVLHMTKNQSVRIGAAYELAVRDYYVGLGFQTSARQAGSKGAYDLIVWKDRDCVHVQCKAGRLACAGAERLRLTLVPGFHCLNKIPCSNHARRAAPSENKINSELNELVRTQS